jgi:hypothetical protein
MSSSKSPGLAHIFNASAREVPVWWRPGRTPSWLTHIWVGDQTTKMVTCTHHSWLWIDEGFPIAALFVYSVVIEGAMSSSPTGMWCTGALVMR